MLGPFYVTNDAQRRAAWGDPCQAVATAGRVTLGGRIFPLSLHAVEPFQAFELVRAKHGYELTGNDTGFYNCRHMQFNDALPMSYHSWGMALDINWFENPAGSRLVTDIPKAMRDELLALRTNSGARVFRWGGDWDWDGISSDHSYIDAMHWEVVAHPLDLATGINLEGVNVMPDFGEKVGVDTIFVQVWQEMLDEGVFSKYTDPDDVPRMEELAAFLSRYTARVVEDKIGAAVAAALNSGGLDIELEGKKLILTVEDVI